MARHAKIGLDYFSHDCINDVKLEYLEAEHGLTGYAIFFKLLEKIYYDNGYYLDYSEKFIKLFSKRHNVESQIVEDIISTCVEEDLFDKGKFKKYGVLTSSGIQKRFKEATVKRKQNDVKNEYNLINSESIDINSESIDINSESSTQSKVKESKVNKSKVNKSRIDDTADRLKFNSLTNYLLFKKECLENEAWINGILLEFEKEKITAETIPIYLLQFGAVQITLDHSGWAQKKDFVRHFKSWLRIYLKNNNNGNTIEKSNSYRRTPGGSNKSLIELEKERIRQTIATNG